MVFGFLIPKSVNFFDLFDKQAKCVVDAAIYFNKLVSNFKVDGIGRTQMKDIEHQADEIAHEISDQLNKTFITPFDREDIHELSTKLDDIVDMLDAIINRLFVYKILSPDRNLTEFAAVIEKAVRGVASAVGGLRNTKSHQVVVLACREVNSLENLGDQMRDDMLGQLFEKYASDPVSVIKLKEIYQDMETVLDVCEDVVHVVQSILVKQA